jgi:hypothetical protein
MQHPREALIHVRDVVRDVRPPPTRDAHPHRSPRVTALAFVGH